MRPRDVAGSVELGLCANNASTSGEGRTCMGSCRFCFTDHCDVRWRVLDVRRCERVHEVDVIRGGFCSSNILLRDSSTSRGLDVYKRQAVIAVRLNNQLLIIDEVSGAHDTDALAQEIRRRFPDHRIYAYPDASGGNRSTNASQTDIQILESYGFTNQSPRSNPPVRDRVAAVQALLENGKGEVRLQVAANCKRTIECLELQSYTEKGDPDKDAGYDHMNDGLGYLAVSYTHLRAHET